MCGAWGCGDSISGTFFCLGDTKEQQRETRERAVVVVGGLRWVRGGSGEEEAAEV